MAQSATQPATKPAPSATTKSNEHYYYAHGRRKSAVATVRLYKGKGELVVNDQPATEYFNNRTLMRTIEAPLVLTGQSNTSRAVVRVSGGGSKGQAEAVSLALARALVVMSEDFRSTLRKSGLLTRDAREKERKKYGLKKARKAPQFSKR